MTEQRVTLLVIFLVLARLCWTRCVTWQLSMMFRKGPCRCFANVPPNVLAGAPPSVTSEIPSRSVSLCNLLDQYYWNIFTNLLIFLTKGIIFGFKPWDYDPSYKFQFSYLCATKKVLMQVDVMWLQGKFWWVGGWSGEIPNCKVGTDQKALTRQVRYHRWIRTCQGLLPCLGTTRTNLSKAKRNFTRCNRA